MPMEANWSSTHYSPINDGDISGSMSNTHPDISGVQETVDYDGSGMDLELVPYTQPDSGHTGQTLYSTNHYAGPPLDMPPTGVYPYIFPTPEQSIPGGSDYGWFPTRSFPGVNYMEGVESTQNTGMMYSANPERSFDVMNYDNNHNFHRSVVLPPSSFNRNFPGVHGMDSMVLEGTPMHDYADIHAQSHNFGLSLDLDPTLTIPTSTMPNSIPLLSPALSPLTPAEPTIATATPTTVADYDHNYGHGYDPDYDPSYDTPAPDLPEQEMNTTVRRSRSRERNRRRVYRTSYDHHPSHRYTCHPCRFSTDVRRDFARHEDTSKHKKKVVTTGKTRGGTAGGDTARTRTTARGGWGGNTTDARNARRAGRDRSVRDQVQESV